MLTQRINITLSADLARDLRRIIPARSRSKFIAKALEEKLKTQRNIKTELRKSLELNYEFYKKVGQHIEKDFQYADAEILNRLP